MKDLGLCEVCGLVPWIVAAVFRGRLMHVCGRCDWGREQ